MSDSPTMQVTRDDQYLAGQMLVAMPGMPDPRFARSVIYICAHNAEGAMGLVVNKPLENITFNELLHQLEIEDLGCHDPIEVQFGGPVEEGRGFVLHTPDYLKDGSLVVDNEVALTATMEILRDIAQGDGPSRSMLALGYAGWGPGQLDEEIMANGWLHVSPDENLIYGPDLEGKWQAAMAKLGIDPRMLSDEAGHA